MSVDATRAPPCSNFSFPHAAMQCCCRTHVAIGVTHVCVCGQGFYDEHLEFLGIERVHIVCTMNPATTVGRHA